MTTKISKGNETVSDIEYSNKNILGICILHQDNDNIELSKSQARDLRDWLNEELNE